MSNDGAAPLFNPAGLARLSRPLFGSSYRAMSQDRSLGYATVMFPVRGESSLGVHWLYAGSGAVEARDADGYTLGRDISQNNHQFTIVFAKRFEKYVSVGANISYLHSTMSELDANSIGFDFGLMFYLEHLVSRDRRDQMAIRDVQIGLTVKNISKVYKWNSEKYNRMYTTDDLGSEQEDNVPVEIGLGTSARFFQRRLLVAADLLKNENQGLAFHGGAEYYLSREFALRGGFSDGRLTAGTGYLFKVAGNQLAIDYAFSTDKADEGSEHIFSLDLLF